MHRYSFIGRAICGIGGCNVLYAIDDEGRERLEWVTCKRCLALLRQGGGP